MVNVKVTKLLSVTITSSQKCKGQTRIEVFFFHCRLDQANTISKYFIPSLGWRIKHTEVELEFGEDPILLPVATSYHLFI